MRPTAALGRVLINAPMANSCQYQCPITVMFEPRTHL
jgi:hypothetical protein